MLGIVGPRSAECEPGSTARCFHFLYLERVAGIILTSWGCAEDEMHFHNNLPTLADSWCLL